MTIGAVELVDHSPTGRTFHRYVCPERPVPADAVAVHGLTTEFLADKPLFAAIADEFLANPGASTTAPICLERAKWRVDTLKMFSAESTAPLRPV
jgi:DNA polymerase III subunit epsilon